jgi:membrane protease YdiL (CAAX protease family)
VQTIFPLNRGSRVVKTDRRVIVFLIIAFVWSWVNWFIGMHYLAPGINDVTIKPFITCLLLGLYGPLLSAVVTTWYFAGFKGLTALLKKFTIWKVPPGIYAVIVLLPLVLTGGSICLYAIWFGSPGRIDTHAVRMVPLVLLAALRAGPIGEELGWRGFLLPQLQRRFSPTVSSLIIGFIWFCWHIPLFFAPVGTAVSGAPITVGAVLFFYIFVTCLACIYTWLVNRSRGSVLVALLMHLSINAALLMLFFPDLEAHSKEIYYLSAPLYVVFTVLLGIKTRFK